MTLDFDSDESAPITRPKVQTVYYDGGCPICKREIGMYRTLEGAETISWVDLVKLPDGDVAPGVTKQNALARLHVIDDNGSIHEGGAAFTALWCMLPKFRALGALCTRWPFRIILAYLYSLFLFLRPVLQVILHSRSEIVKRDI